MTPVKTSCLITAVVLLFSPLFISGCATKGYQKAAATSDTSASAAAQVDLARQQVTEAISALQGIAVRPPAELRPAFTRYQDAVAALDQTVASLKAQTKAMETQGRKYFDTWDERMAKMQNEDIRARSEARQQEVVRQYSDLQHRYEDARQQFDPFLSNLHDIQGLLSVDLTPAGVASAKEFVAKANANAVSVRRALDNLADGLRAFSQTLDPAAAAKT